jgi:uncharacterized membrane protein YidH (DUF202 family)
VRRNAREIPHCVRDDQKKAGVSSSGKRIHRVTQPVQELGKLIVILGFVLVAIGLVLWLFVGRFPRLPGDIVVQKENFTFYFPLATCIVISVILTLLFWLFRR